LVRQEVQISITEATNTDSGADQRSGDLAPNLQVRYLPNNHFSHRDQTSQAGDGQTEVEYRANCSPVREVFEENRHPDKSHTRICGAVLLHDFKNAIRRHFWMVAAFTRDERKVILSET